MLGIDQLSSALSIHSYRDNAAAIACDGEAIRHEVAILAFVSTQVSPVVQLLVSASGRPISVLSGA